jgi:hypothetical protein
VVWKLIITQRKILETEDALSKIQTAVWIASATSPLIAGPYSNSWLEQNQTAFPAIFSKALQSERLLNSPKTIGK